MSLACPICGKIVKSPGDGEDSVSGKYFPFCSERCRLIDLGAWLEGDYKIAESDPEGDDDLAVK